MDEKEKQRTRRRRGRGEGGIYQRGDGLWTASVSLGYNAEGRRLRRVIYGSTKKEVQDKLRDEQNKVGSGLMPDAQRIKVSEFLTSWLDDLKAKGTLRPTTVQRYDIIISQHLVPHVGNMVVSKLQPIHVERLYAEMAKAGASLDAQQKAGIVLGAGLRHAVRRKLLMYNPVRDVEKPQPTRPDIRPLNTEQAARFLKAAKTDRLYPMYVLALDSGMRQGELFALAWDEIDWSEGTVQVRHSLEDINGTLRVKEVKTKKGRRRIKLAASTIAALNEHRRKMLAEGRDVKTGPVFCDLNGGHLRKSNVIRRSFKKILRDENEAAEKEAAEKGVAPDLLPNIRFHDLRHTCATMLLLANVNPKIVSERLGHSKVSITLDIYSHVLPTMQDGAAAQIERLLHAKA
jgi:integrase